MSDKNFRFVKSIDGWLSHVDAVLISAIIGALGRAGSLGGFVEIGVHHGKSFVFIAREGHFSSHIAIDLFDDQSLNTDNSGLGNQAKFESNVSSSLSLDRVRIIAGDSTSLTRDEILADDEFVSLFHIDGGHTFDCTLSDLKLAAACISDVGVILIDDPFRSEWPEVSWGLYEFLRQHNDIGLCCIGSNKAVLCRKSNLQLLAETLDTSALLQSFKVKQALIGDSSVSVYGYPLIHARGLTDIARWYLINHKPSLLISLRNVSRRFFAR